jgi:hypothetical protein
VKTSYPSVGKSKSQAFECNTIHPLHRKLYRSIEKQRCFYSPYFHPSIFRGCAQKLALRAATERHAGARPVNGFHDRHEPTRGPAETGKMYGSPTVSLPPFLISLRRPWEGMIMNVATLYALPLARENIPPWLPNSRRRRCLRLARM